MPMPVNGSLYFLLVSLAVALLLLLNFIYDWKWQFIKLPVGEAYNFFGRYWRRFRDLWMVKTIYLLSLLFLYFALLFFIFIWTKIKGERVPAMSEISDGDW